MQFITQREGLLKVSLFLNVDASFLVVMSSVYATISRPSADINGLVCEVHAVVCLGLFLPSAMMASFF